MAAIRAAAVRSAGQQDERDDRGPEQGQAVIIVVEDEVLIRNDVEAEYLELGHAPKSATIPGASTCRSASVSFLAICRRRAAGRLSPTRAVLLERAGPRRHFRVARGPRSLHEGMASLFSPLGTG